MAIVYKPFVSSFQKAASDVLIIPVLKKKQFSDLLPSSLQKHLAKRMKELKFEAVLGSAELFLAETGNRTPFVAMVGLGDESLSLDARAEGLRRGIGRVLQDARRHGLRTFTIVLEGGDAMHYLQVSVEALELSNYRFAQYGKHLAKEQATRSVQSVTFLLSRSQFSKAIPILRRVKKIMRAISLTRDLVNQPASHMSPALLVEQARQIADSSSTLSLRVMDRQEAKKNNFRGFLAVARGSMEEPYVIHLIYKPTKKAMSRVALIGKGITFDSGGLSLKPADYMMDMKIDMAGAATVLGLFSVLPALNLPVEVHGIIAACENMPSGNAYRPGDVVEAKNGKTIEVLNTDAEGRITLADALTYAQEFSPDVMIDLATLTGACLIAVGETHAGMWSNDEDLAKTLQISFQKAGEGVVPFPLPEEYKQFIRSKVADLRNIGTTRYGDAILAALFLEEFVGKIPWAHLDMAGPVYSNASSLPYFSHGATGYGVRTLIHFLEQRAEASL